MNTQTSSNIIIICAVVLSLGMTALFFACDTHTITNPNSIEEVETAIGSITEVDASPLFIVNREIVQDISHINAADIESVRLIRGSDVTAFRLRNVMESTSGRLSGNADAFHAVHGQEAEGRRMIIRSADSEEQETEGIRMIIRGENSKPEQVSEERRIIRTPGAEQSTGQSAMLRNTSRKLLDGELAEKISGHPQAFNGVVIITLRADGSNTSGSEK